MAAKFWARNAKRLNKKEVLINKKVQETVDIDCKETTAPPHWEEIAAQAYRDSKEYRRHHPSKPKYTGHIEDTSEQSIAEACVYWGCAHRTLPSASKGSKY